MAYDSRRHVTVLFGGVSGSTSSTILGDTWEWDGSAWSQRATSGPSPRIGHTLVFDSQRGVTVLYGGGQFSGQYTDTWEWDGATWTQTATGPLRSYHASAYDSQRGVTVLSTGLGTGGLQNDTWEYGGSTWTQRPVTGPPRRETSAMAYDSHRGFAILFGGYGDVGGGFADRLADTWEWNGTAWTQRAVTGPSPRELLAMAYDSARGVTVLFGGRPVSASETWEWNGTAWAQQNISGPPARFWHAMAYDSARGVTVLFGGTSDGSILLNDTWELSSPLCYPNCDHSTSPPILNVADFTCYLQKFSLADQYANCDGSTSAPTLNVQDFTCFLQKFAQGCP